MSWKSILASLEMCRRSMLWSIKKQNGQKDMLIFFIRFQNPQIGEYRVSSLVLNIELLLTKLHSVTPLYLYYEYRFFFNTNIL